MPPKHLPGLHADFRGMFSIEHWRIKNVLGSIFFFFFFFFFFGVAFTWNSLHHGISVCYGPRNRCAGGGGGTVYGFMGVWRCTVHVFVQTVVL